MKDGLFKQYFRLFMALLLFCVVFLGIAMLVISGVNYTSQRRQILMSAAVRSAEQAVELWNGTSFPYAETRQMLTVAAQDYSVEVYVTGPDGRILCCSENLCHHGDTAPARGLKSIAKDGSYESGAYFQGFVGRDADYITGIPVEAGGDTVGYLFTTTSIRPLFAYLTDTMFTYMFSVIMMLTVAFVVIYTATAQLTTPLHEMSLAAEAFGKGNFDARVEVRGDDEIAVLAKSFNKMADSLSEFETNRRSFVANVSHDLRTPMTTIGGYIDGILDGTIPAEEQDRYLEIASDEVKRLARLTSSLLQVMKLEENRKEDIELDNVNARDIIINILLNMEKRIEDKHLYIPDLELPDAMYLLANKDMFHQVIYNLLDNAVKYTPEGGELELTVRQGEEKTEIAVTNSGKGIAPEEQPYIFERFYKTDKSRGIDRNGTGLGLYIVKMLTDGMGGDIRVESDGEIYTRFAVTMKNGKPPMDAVIAAPAAAPEKKKPWYRLKMPFFGTSSKQDKKQ